MSTRIGSVSVTSVSRGRRATADARVGRAASSLSKRPPWRRSVRRPDGRPRRSPRRARPGGRSCGRSRRRPRREASRSGQSDQPRTRIRTRGAVARSRSMNARPPSSSGSRGSIDDDVGAVASHELERRPGAGRRCRRPRRRAPMPRSAVRLSRTRSSASTTRTRSGATVPGSGSCMAPWCGRGPATAERTDAEVAPRPNDGVRPTSSVADRRGRQRRDGRRARRRPARRGVRDERPRSWSPRPARSCSENVAPIRSARASIPARPRWPAGTWRGSNPLPSSCDAQPDAAARRGRPRPGPGARAGVLDDVVERLLRDPIERLLDRRAAAARPGRSPRRPAGRSGPGAPPCASGAPRPGRPARGCPGRSSKMSARISASASRCSSRSCVELRLGRLDVALEQQLDRARHEGHREQRLGHRVVQLAGEVGPLLAGGELAGLAPQVALEPVALADVAGGAVGADEPPVLDHADAVDLDEDVVPVGVAERQPRPVDRRRVPAEPRNRTSASRRALAAKTSQYCAADQRPARAGRAWSPRPRSRR